MSKEKKLIFNYISWFLFLFIIIFVGVSNIFALETKTIYGGVNNGTLTDANKYNYGVLNQGGTQSILSGNVNTTISGISYFFGFYYYDTIQLNKTYTLVINFMDSDLLNSFQSGWVKIQTCYSSTCNDTTLVSVVKNNNSGNSNKLTINFNPISVGSYVLVRLSGDNNNSLTGINTFGIKSIQTESTNESQDIIDNQTNNTNNIINNNNSNTQDIIDNQNSSSSAIQDSINDNLNSCHDSVNLFNINGNVNVFGTDGSTVSGVNTVSNNVLYAGSNAYNTDGYGQKFTNLNGKTFTISADLISNGTGDGGYLIIYENNSLKAYKSSTAGNSIFITYTGTSNDLIVAFSTNNGLNAQFTNIQLQLGTSVLPYEEYGTHICKNKIDDTNERLNQTNQQLGDLNSNLTDETGPNTSGLSNVAGWLPPGPVDSILTLPLTFLNSLNNAIGGTCSAVNVNLPFVNKTLNIPCFTTFMSQYLPNFNTLYTWIGGIVSVYILFNYLLSLYKWVDDTLSLRENTMPGYFDDRFGGGA